MASWGSCDFKQLQKLQSSVERLATADMERFCQAVSRELAQRLLALVIPRTPVGVKPTLAQLGGEGTKKSYKIKGASGKSRSLASREAAILHTHWSGYTGGTLRRGWTAKNEEEARGKKGGASASELDAFAKTLQVAKIGDSYQIIVRNPVKHASYVEFGHVQTPGRYVPQLGKQLKRAYVPGQYFLSIAEAQLEAWLPSYLEKRIQAFLMEVFTDE